jgi:PhnB protein
MVAPIPEIETSAMKLHTYLNYGGNCEQAFRFYGKHLGGKVTMMMTHGEQPNAKDVPPDQKNAIHYARMSVGETDLMGSDVPPQRFQPMRSVYLSPCLEQNRRRRASWMIIKERALPQSA